MGTGMFLLIWFFVYVILILVLMINFLEMLG